MTVIPVSTTFADPRMKVGAYIRDRTDLYEVTGIVRPSYPGGSAFRIEVENCRSLQTFQLTPDKVRSDYQLVKAAPAAVVPDDVEHIAWEAA